MEAYVTMVYGPADASSLRGLHVLLDSLRAHEATDGDGAQTPREVLVLRLLDDDDSPALEAACRRYAPARVHRVARLALDPRIHPTCARQLSAWAGATSSADRGAASGSGSGSGGGGGRQLKQHGGAGEKAHHRREQLSLPMRSIFSVFAVWSLANQGYSRVLWLETDQLVVGSLAGLWRMQLPYAPPLKLPTTRCIDSSTGGSSAHCPPALVLPFVPLSRSLRRVHALYARTPSAPHPTHALEHAHPTPLTGRACTRPPSRSARWAAAPPAWDRAPPSTTRASCCSSRTPPSTKRS